VERARGAGDSEGASRFRLVAVVVFGTSVLLEVVPARGRPFRPEERCCCSESEVVGAGVLGGSGFTFGGLPTRLLGGSGASETLESIDCDLLTFAAGVALLSPAMCFRVAEFSCFGGRPGLRFGLSVAGESWSDRGLTSLSSRDGDRALNGRGVERFFQGVELPLRTAAFRPSGLGTGVVAADAGYW